MSFGAVEMGWTHGMDLVWLWKPQALEDVETSYNVLPVLVSRQTERDMRKTCTRKTERNFEFLSPFIFSTGLEKIRNESNQPNESH